MVTATPSSASAIEVTWKFTSPPEPDCNFTYRVERKTTGEYVAIVSDQEETEHSDSGLSANTQHFYRIIARGTDGESSGIDSATTLCPAPSGLVLNARATSRSRISLSWRVNNLPSGCEPSYKIERKRGSGRYVTLVESQTTNTYSDTELSSGTTYWYRLTASNSGGSVSDEDSATTHRRPTPPPNPEPGVSRPTGLSATAGSWSEIEVSWNAVSGADRYDTQVMESGGSWGAAVDAGAGTSYSYTGLTMNTQYSVRVRAVDGSRTSGWTAPVSATTDVQPPGNPAATAESASAIRVTWDAITGADRYDLRRSEDGGSWGSPMNVGSGTEYLVSGLAAATTHDFQLRTVAGSRTSDWTASVSATTGSPDPDPPANFRSTGATATTVALGWDAVSGADHYRIRRAASGESGWESFTVETTSAVDEGLDPATAYRYQIQTVPAKGRPSEWSAPALSVTTAALGIPANLTVTGQTATTVSLAWDAEAEAEGYELRRDGGAVIAVGAGTSHTDERLTPDTAYSYEVRSSLGSAHSAWSPAIPARTARVMPPENLRAKATSAFSVEVGWDPVVGADGYEVDRVHDPGSVRVTGTRHEETGLAPETSYAFRVRAIAGRTESDWAPEVSAVTLAFSAPENFAASASETTVELRWDPVPGTETYRIRRRQGSGSWERLEETGTSASDEGLEEETEYEYQVRARRGPHKSPWSAAARVTTGFVPLTAPRGFRVEERGGAHIELSWEAVSSAEGYDLERRTPNERWISVAAALAATTYLDQGLRPNFSYRYRLRAVRGARTSKWSGELRQWTSAEVAAPGRLVAKAVSPTEVALRWEAVPGGDISYRIRRKVRGGPSNWSNAYSGSGTGARDAGLEPLTEYEYEGLTIYRLWGQPYRSEWTDPVYAITEAPAAPTLRLDSVTEAAVELEWNAVTGAVGYEVQRRSPADSGSWTSVGKVPAAAFTDSEVVAGQEYEYQVRAFVRNGLGRILPTGWSDSVVAEPGG